MDTPKRRQTFRDREAEVKRRLYQYARYKGDIVEYFNEAFITSTAFSLSGVHGTAISDRTANTAIAHIEVPNDILVKKQWVAAIEKALDELRSMDAADGNERGYVYICTRLYGLDGKRHNKRKNRDTAIKIADDCFISVRTLYYKMNVILKVVMFHVADEGLLK